MQDSDHLAGPERALLAAILDQVGEAIISVDEDQRITTFNKRAEALFGYPAEEAVGMPMEELIPVRFRGAHRPQAGKFMASGETSRRMGARLEIAGRRRDGSEFPAEAAISRVESEGNVIATVMIQDITERLAQMDALRASEARLIQAEKMAAIGTMASGIGHEINNPLYSIVAMAEAIRDGNEVARAQAYGRDIITQSKRISDIVRNLSRYARPADEHDLELVDVNEKLRAAVAMARRSLLSDHVEITETLPPVPAISAKSEDIQQALYNIVRNGIQAMHGRGALEVASHHEDGEVLVTVRDTGTGIAAEHVGKIYDPFFTTKGPDEGEGLGLYIVRQIIEQYAGTIGVESTNGEGTVFSIRFLAGTGTAEREDHAAQDTDR